MKSLFRRRVDLYHGLHPNCENGVTVPIEIGSRFGALLHDLRTAREGVMMDLQTVLLKALAYGYVEKLNQLKPLREAIDLPDEK